MYYSGITPTDISAELNIPISELRKHIFGHDERGHDADCWYVQRQKQDPDDVVPFVRARYHVLSQVDASLLKKVLQSARELCDPSNPDFSLEEMNMATQIIERLNKMFRLEKGEATEQVQVEHSFNLREIVNGARMDNGSSDDIEDVDYSPLSSNPSSDN